MPPGLYLPPAGFSGGPFYWSTAGPYHLDGIYSAFLVPFDVAVEGGIFHAAVWSGYDATADGWYAIVEATAWTARDGVATFAFDGHDPHGAARLLTVVTGPTHRIFGDDRPVGSGWFRIPIPAYWAAYGGTLSVVYLEPDPRWAGHAMSGSADLVGTTALAPEPASLALLGTGLAGVAFVRSRRVSRLGAGAETQS